MSLYVHIHPLTQKFIRHTTLLSLGMNVYHEHKVSLGTWGPHTPERGIRTYIVQVALLVLCTMYLVHRTCVRDRRESVVGGCVYMYDVICTRYYYVLCTLYYVLCTSILHRTCTMYLYDVHRTRYKVRRVYI